MRAIRKVKPVKLRDASAIIIQANAAHLPLPNNSVDLIVTSPPYFALRSYTDAGEHYAGQLGSEATPQEFLEALWTCTREWVRVLKPTGSIFVNLGDKYGQSAGQWQGSRRGQGGVLKGTKAEVANQFGQGAWNEAPDTGRPKSLMGLPWRYALGCIDQLGLILRAEIIWEKPNGLPESVKDRVRRSHEQWFHFTRQPRYFAAVDEIRERYAPGTAARYKSGYGLNARAESGNMRGSAGTVFNGDLFDANPLGKLPGSVWNVPTEPLKIPEHLNIQHFAAFPSEWPRRIILGWSPSGICVQCGEGRRPVTAKSADSSQGTTLRTSRGSAQLRGIDRTEMGSHPRDVVATITGYACACPAPDAPTRPAVVLDPLGGTGTTAGVAFALGRTGISVDLSHDYSRLARWRACEDYTLRNKVWKKSPVYRPTTNQEGVA